MLRILTSLALLHWAALFALLALVCVFADLDHLASSAIHGAPHVSTVTPVEAGVLAICCLVCVCLFAWSALTMLADEDPDPEGQGVASTAFAFAATVLTAVMIAAALFGSGAVFAAVAVAVAALLVSCFIMLARERSARIRTRPPQKSAASLAATLVRLSSSSRASPGEVW